MGGQQPGQGLLCSREDWEHIGCYGGSFPPPQALGPPCPTAQLPSTLQGGCCLLNTFMCGLLNSRLSPMRSVPLLALFYRWEGWVWQSCMGLLAEARVHDEYVILPRGWARRGQPAHIRPQAGSREEGLPSLLLEMVARRLVELKGAVAASHTPCRLASVLERQEQVRKGLVAPGPSVQEGSNAPYPLEVCDGQHTPAAGPHLPRYVQAAEMHMRYWPGWAICTRSREGISI